MQLWRSPFRHVRTAAFLAAAAAILLSANSVLNDFAYDDRLIIIESDLVKDLSTLPEAVTSPYWPGKFGEALGLWRPVTTGLFALQWALWGENAAAFHALNVLLHGAVTALVVLLLAELAPARARVRRRPAVRRSCRTRRGGGQRGGVGRGALLGALPRRVPHLRETPGASRFPTGRGRHGSLRPGLLDQGKRSHASGRAFPAGRCSR